MKKIKKIEPEFYSSYQKNKKPKTWEELSRDIGADIRTYMLSGILPCGTEITPSEQNYQCAYTELDIEINNSHIDHFRRKSGNMFPRLIFDWSNLFTATNRDGCGAKFKDRNIRKEDYEYLINPALENPDKYLTYNLLGRVVEVSKDTESREYKIAKTTIDLFNLNEPSLKAHRLAVSKQVKSICKQLSLVDIKSNIGRFDSFVEFAYKAYKQVKHP